LFKLDSSIHVLLLSDDAFNESDVKINSFNIPRRKQWWWMEAVPIK